MSSLNCVALCHASDLFNDPDFQALVTEYSAECADPKLTMPAPKLEFYEALEANGSTQCFAVRLNLAHPLDTPRLVGFAFVLLSASGANGCRYATVERLFVSTEGREHGLGNKLMDTMCATAKLAGCEAIFIVAHVGTRLARMLFLSADRYENTGHLFRRRLA